MKLKNLFDGIPAVLTEEIFHTLLETEHVRVERIVSLGQAAPGPWYDQPKDEWVLVLRGSAGLRFEGQDEIVVLRVGDYIQIPAHQRHRVEWTEAGQRTLWLALHYE